MISTVRRRVLAPVCAIAAIVLGACGGMERLGSGVTNLLPTYKVGVVQGNFISKQQVEALQPGMNRQQVADLLGTPLLASVFHADRWDYAFSMKTQGSEPISRKLTVFFKGDLLERFEGDEMMTESEFAAKVAQPKKGDATPRVLEASEESLKALAPATPIPEAAVAPAPAVPTVYPPLEPATR
jgi:outer membrane protein assembly factor BamE